MLITLLYVSSAVRRLNAEELEEILASSRRNNERAGITGMLLYAGGNFIQALEGPEPAVDELLNRIEQDRRHRGVIRLARYRITQRQFPNWSMGYRRIRGAEAAGLIDVISPQRPVYDPATPEAQSRAHRLLEQFRATNRD